MPKIINQAKSIMSNLFDNLVLGDVMACDLAWTYSWETRNANVQVPLTTVFYKEH